MPLKINLRHVETEAIELQGELSPEELGLIGLDELVTAPLPLQYDLEAQILEDALLVRGSIEIPLRCECSRCLKPYTHTLEYPDWACHLPLKGEDSVPIDNDLVDLTPYLREDILLDIPQHPLCEPDCCGLSKTSPSIVKKPSGASQNVESSSAWAELNKLKFEKE
jgi:uncharacterized metal-binding protein YceD (DUF177 family)